MEYVGGIEPQGAARRRRRAATAARRPAAGRPGDRVRARDPAGARATCTGAGCCSATSSPTTSSRPALAEAHRPRRRLPHRRRLRARSTARRLPGARDRRGRGPSRRLRPLHGRRGRSRCCALDFRGLPDDATNTRCRRGARCRSTSATTRCTGCCAGHRADPDDRFQSAEEMADQLLGVLREVVAAEHGRADARRAARCSPATRPRAHRPRGWRCCRRCASRPTTRRPATSRRSPPPDPDGSLDAAARGAGAHRRGASCGRARR